MVSHSELINDILDRLSKAEDYTLSFSFLLKSSGFSRRELFYILDCLEHADLVFHTTDFWGDIQNYTLVVKPEEINVTTIQFHL